jgi:hypothetical protein
MTVPDHLTTVYALHASAYSLPSARVYVRLKSYALAVEFLASTGSFVFSVRSLIERVLTAPANVVRRAVLKYVLSVGSALNDESCSGASAVIFFCQSDLIY